MSVDPGSYQPAPYQPPSSDWTSALWSAPDLWNTPGLAATAATSGDAELVGQTLAHVNSQVSYSGAVQQQDKNSGGWFSSMVHHVAGVIGAGLNLAAKPLQDVQHEYRYIKTSFSRGNYWVGAAMLAAGVAGTLLAGPVGGMLAAEATGELGRFDRKNWAYSQNHGGSIGRDLAHGLGLNDTNSGFGKVVSGLGDATFDLSADPLIKLGKLSALRRSEEGFADSNTVLARTLRRSSAVDKMFNRWAPGTAMRTPDQIDAAYKAYGGYRRALRDIVSIKDKGTIVARYPELQNLADDKGRNLLDQMVRADSEGQVHDIFRGVAFDREWQDRIQLNALPSRSVMRVKGTAVIDKLRGDISRDQELPLVLGKRRFTDAAGNAQSQWTLGALFRPIALARTPEGNQQWTRNLQAAMSRKIRTFSGYQPFAMEKGSAEITRQFAYEDDRDAQGLLRSMRFSMGERTARQKLDEYMSARDPITGAANVGLRKQIWGEVQNEILKAAGFPDDPEAYAHLSQKVRHMVAGPMHTVAYGAGHDLGDDVNQSVDTDGSVQRSGLWDYQTSEKGTFPDFRDLRSTMRKLHTYSSIYGRIDDFAAKAFTDSYFKPLALLTGGFGLRIAAAEAIPASLRYGAFNMLRTRVGLSAAKGQYKLATGEDGFVTRAAAKAAGGIDKLLGMSEEERGWLVRSVMDSGGQVTHGVASAGHSGWSQPDDPGQAGLYQLDQSVKRHGRMFWRGSGRFQLFPADDSHFAEMWHYNSVRVSRERSAQLIAQDFKTELGRTGDQDLATRYAVERETQRIKGIDPESGQLYGAGHSGVSDPYVTGREKLRRYPGQDAAQFATHRVDALRGLFTGRDDTVHDYLLNKFAAGDNSISEAKLKSIEPDQRPKHVAGEVPEPFIGPNVYQRVTQEGFVRVVDPIINHLSREPIYGTELIKQMRAMKPAISDGVLDEDHAFYLARERAVRAMVPQIHNTQIRSQFHLMVRNLMPFYFAQEQALKRAGHLIKRNPAAFREYQLIEHSINDPGFVNVDDQGNRHLLLPYVGELGIASNFGLSALGMAPVGGLPMTVTGDMQSLRTVLPELGMPSTSPFMAIPLSKLANLDPAFAPIIHGVLGNRGYNESLLQGLLPNSPMRNLVHAAMASEGDTSFSNAMMSAIQTAAFHGQLPPENDPVAQQAFIDRIKNNARSVFFVKAIISAISPLSPAVENTDYGLRDEFYKLVKSKGNYVDALNAFLKQHGNRAISYTVARSKSTTGASVPVAQPAIDFVLSHEALIKKFHWGAAFVTPQETTGGGDAQVLYSELLRDHLRSRETPAEFMRAVYSTTGAQAYFNKDKAYQAELVKAGTNSAAADQLRSEFGIWQNQVFPLVNPIAHDYLFGPEKTTNAILAYQDLSSMFNTGAAPNTPQSRAVYQLTQDYERHRQDIARLGTSTALGHSRALERDAWDKYLTDLAGKEPTLAPVINTVFKRLESIQ